MTEAFWKDVLARRTFNSIPGRALQADAKKKLAALDRKLPLDLLADVYRFYLRDAPYDLWATAKKTRDEHAATYAAVLDGARLVPATFLAVAHQQGGAEGLRTAADFVALTSKTTNLPSQLKSLAKRESELPIEPLVAAAIPTLARHLDEQPSDLLCHFGLVYLVARAAPKHAIMADLRAAFARWGDPHGALARILAAADAGRV